MKRIIVNHDGSKRRLTFSIFLGIWLLKLFLGGVDVTSRQVPSYPDAVKSFPDIGQVELYVFIPLTFVILNFVLLWFSNRIRRWLAIVISFLQIFLLLALLLAIGGI